MAAGKSLTLLMGYRSQRGPDLYDRIFECRAIEDLLNKLNNSDANVLATLNATKTGSISALD